MSKILAIDLGKFKSVTCLLARILIRFSTRDFRAENSYVL
jgi:hypothetical protein